MADATVTLVPSHSTIVPGWLGVPISLAEQFGLVIAESLAVGTPVVAYCTGSIPEVVGPGGFVCPAGDVYGITRSTRRLLDDRKLRSEMACEGRSWVERFSEDRIAEELARLWDLASAS
jgi:glycosyltransferase involved in cell wall biosynthesis